MVFAFVTTNTNKWIPRTFVYMDKLISLCAISSAESSWIGNSAKECLVTERVSTGVQDKNSAGLCFQYSSVLRALVSNLTLNCTCQPWEPPNWQCIAELCTGTITVFTHQWLIGKCFHFPCYLCKESFQTQLLKNKTTQNAAQHTLSGDSKISTPRQQ